ncbi:MAG: hypothetical protein PHD74_03125 [Candidatus Krumholzibacteria bacterium]|nr:hypothetical protein [Candidatus Krumholzibacteria bacterium]
MGREGRGRAATRAKRDEVTCNVDAAIDLEDDERPELPPSDLNLCIAILDWWEVARWHEVADENALWGDPSPGTARIVRDLRKGKQMDT